MFYILHLITFSFPLACLAQQYSLSSSPEYGHSIDAARHNAPYIFNALHSSMRQWGSSLKHNGLSFFPAAIPANTYLYHGTYQKGPAKGMEWLALEPEHAEFFARARRTSHESPDGNPPRLPDDDPTRPDELRDAALLELVSRTANGSPKGYLHVYQTTRKLSRLLYIDGMSAEKTSLGTLNLTDIVLRNTTDGNFRGGEMVRALDLCALGSEWNIEGFIRLEAGFELILCNFTNGLELRSAKQRPLYDETIRRFQHFEYMR